MTVRCRELNNKLVPIMLDRLHSLHKQAEKLTESNANISVNSSRPFAHLAKEKKENSGSSFDYSFLVLYLRNLFHLFINFSDNSAANNRDSLLNNGLVNCNTQENPMQEHVNGYIHDIDMSELVFTSVTVVEII